MKLRYRRDLNCLECPSCPHMISVPRFIMQNPQNYVLYHEAAERAHAHHRQRQWNKPHASTREQLLHLARHTLGFIEQPRAKVSSL